MIRLRRLQPDTVRGIRHWAIELAVVVVGVLLALWVAEWAEDRREARADALAEAAVREELVRNLVVISIWEAAKRCQVEHATIVADKLVSSGNEWPGLDRRSLNEEPATIPFATLFVYYRERPSFSAWTSAVDSGVFERMPKEKRDAFAGSYGLVKVMDATMEKAIGYADELGGLSFPQPMDDQTRSKALRDLSGFVTASNNIHTALPAIDFGATATDIATMRAHIAEFEEMIEPLGFRDCYGPVQLPQAIRERE